MRSGCVICHASRDRQLPQFGDDAHPGIGQWCDLPAGNHYPDIFGDRCLWKHGILQLCLDHFGCGIAPHQLPSQSNGEFRLGRLWCGGDLCSTHSKRQLPRLFGRANIGNGLGCDLPSWGDDQWIYGNGLCWANSNLRIYGHSERCGKSGHCLSRRSSRRE